MIKPVFFNDDTHVFDVEQATHVIFRDTYFEDEENQVRFDVADSHDLTLHLTDFIMGAMTELEYLATSLRMARDFLVNYPIIEVNENV